jgi:hypothetical protein
MEQVEGDLGEIVLERRFKVGELVAFVEGQMLGGTGLIAGRQHG